MLLTIFCPVVRSQEHLAPIMSFHLSLFKMVGLHYMPFFACHDCKDNTSSAAGLKIYRIQLSGDELRLGASAAVKGDRQLALDIVNKVRAAEDRTEPAVLIASIYARLGLATEMYEWLERAFAL